jgi:beta-glucosidase
MDVEQVLAGLTLEHKAGLTSGADFWHTKWAPGVPAVMVSDGPHGVRKQVVEGGSAVIGESVPATCFPTAAALGSSWDVDLVRRVGEALGRETRANGISVLLGPGVNIKRSPLCGRNFEYFSEDPVVAGELGAALVDGIQSQGVGASLKHFAANNQESDRMRVSADVDERTLREIYLPAFERVVTRSQPWTVMCSYNRVNGTYASEHRWLLTEVLRDEWGFEGLVVSDWGAVHDRVAALRAGLDLQMPSAGTRPDDEVIAAVRAGAIDESVVDASARRVLRLVERSQAALADPGGFDAAAHHELAREAAAAGAVLLKNDTVHEAPLLPLHGADGLLVVGEFARTPRYQGAGSSQVNPTRLDAPLDALVAATGADVRFEPAFTIEGAPAGDDDELRDAAVEAAREAGVVVAFLGLPGPAESEGYDRTAIDLPANQVAALEAIAAVNPRVVVVLANGSAVSVSPWADLAPAILETWLGGQAGGSAVAELLLGRVSPSGRLTETIPHRLEDTPAFGNFPGEAGHVRYGEGLLVGYRWYDTRGADVAFPFGHGLAYTTFAYDDAFAVPAGDGVDVRVRVTNTGAVDAAEVVQVYVADPQASAFRPVHELKAFARIFLGAGESREVAFHLTARDLSYWHPGVRRWVLEDGRFVIEIGASSRDVRAVVPVDVAGEVPFAPLGRMSTVSEWLAHPVGGPLLRGVSEASGAAELDAETAAMARDVPLLVAADFRFVPVNRAEVERLLDAVAASGGQTF